MKVRITATKIGSARSEFCLAKFSAIPEVVNGECGILVNDPFSPEELAKAILTLLKNPMLREKLGKRGREIVLSIFQKKFVNKK